MDILKIVNDKVSGMLEAGAVETLIAEAIENTITKEIKGAFSGYEFRRDIEQKLKTEIDEMLKSISFESYRGVMINQMTTIVEEMQGEKFAELARCEFESIFGKTEPLKLSKLFEMVREDYKDDDGASYDEYFTLAINDKREEGKYLHGWIHIYFDEDDEKSFYSCANEIALSINSNGDGEIKRLKIDGVEYSKKQFSFGYLSDWEKALVNAYFTKTPLIVDVTDDGYVDKSKFDEC